MTSIKRRARLGSTTSAPGHARPLRCPPGYARSSAGGARTGTISAEGQPVARDGSNGLTVRINVVTEGYLETIGIPILLGRSFRPGDDERAPRVAIVGKALAQRLWPGVDPIGRSLNITPAATVIGVVPDAVYASAVERDPPPFFPHSAE